MCTLDYFQLIIVILEDKKKKTFRIFGNKAAFIISFSRDKNSKYPDISIIP